MCGAMRIGGIIQARMGSTRLPGKVLMPLAGHSVLGWVVRAARASGALDSLVVATTTLPEDDAVVTECARLGVEVHRGPVDDVLSRFLGALDLHEADAVARFTADCPLLDPGLITAAVAAFRAVPGLDYLSTSMPRNLPRGMDVEIVAARVLREVGRLATAHHRTHVTSYVYTHAELFTLMGLTFPPDAADLRVTLDTAEDWRLIEAVVDWFGDSPVPLRTLTEWLTAHPEIRLINAEVRQKALEQA